MDKGQPIAIKKDCLAGLAIFGNKEKESAREEIKFHFLDDNEGEGIMPFSHVHIVGVEKDGILRVKNHRPLLQIQ